jgi:hypothetical protein
MVGRALGLSECWVYIEDAMKIVVNPESRPVWFALRKRAIETLVFEQHRERKYPSVLVR